MIQCNLIMHIYALIYPSNNTSEIKAVLRKVEMLLSKRPNKYSDVVVFVFSTSADLCIQ